MRRYVVSEDMEHKVYDSLGSLAFSSNGRHVAYVAQSRGNWFVVVDGVEGPPRTGVIDLRIDQEREYVAYARTGDEVISETVNVGTSIGDGFPRQARLSFDDSGNIDYVYA